MNIDRLGNRARFLCALSLTLFGASMASAQEVAVDQHAESATTEAPSDDETSLNIAAGGTLSTGNTRSWQVNAGGDMRIVRDVHAVGAMVNFIYGRTDLPDDGVRVFEDTVRNLNAKLRYDYFLSDMDALFLAAGFRWDTFAGLDARIQGQAGYLRNFVLEENSRFWGEIGYDITYDNYTDDVLRNNPVQGVDEVDVVHSARGFLGYDNHVTETLTWLTGLEALVNVETPRDFRVNWDNALRSKIGGNFQLEVKFSLKYDNVPVPGTNELDTLTQLNLIYNLI